MNRRAAAVGSLAALLAAALAAQDTLDRRHAEFLDAVEPILTDAERRVFGELRHAYQRDAFIQRFWAVRDPFPETPQNEFHERFLRAGEIADQRFGGVRDDRFQALLLHGEPFRAFRTSCELLRVLEVWHYAHSPAVRGEFYLVFLRQGGDYRRWTRADGVASLLAFGNAVTDDLGTANAGIGRSTIENGRIPGSGATRAGAARAGTAGSIEAIARRCSRGGDLLTALGLALDERTNGAKTNGAKTNGEWALAFLDRSTETPAGVAALPAEIAMRYPGRRGGRTVVQAIVGIDPSHLPAPPASPGEAKRFVLDGEVLRRGELFESFRYRFEQPSGPAGGDGGALVLQRYLRPGAYRLVVKIRDLVANRFFAADADLDVPLLPSAADIASPAVAPAADASAPADRLLLAAADAAPQAGTSRVALPLVDTSLVDTLAPPSRTADARAPSVQALSPVNDTDAQPDWLAEANAPAPLGHGDRTHTLRLHPLPERLVTGRVRVGAAGEGNGIHRVAFALDGRELVSKRRPPYEVDIDVGPAPRIRQLRAVAYDEQGEVLASDELALNSGPHRFVVRLVSPRQGARHVQSVRAAAEVVTPRHERLDRVEFFLNDTRAATLYQPPFEQPIRIGSGEPLSYVRAVAYLDTGRSTEDVVFVNSRNLVEQVEVALVELHVSAMDRSGSPLRGLVETDFTVFVDGKRQPLQRFDNAADQPIHAGILFDTSISMADRLEAAEEAALHFFELVLGPRDRACLITFNDRPELAVGFTGSSETLAGGLADIDTEGETALYDSILYALHYFGGLRGKRALILLTDGADSRSEHRFDSVLDFARRSQVAIYSIGIDIDGRDLLVRGRLQQLCDATGGRCFFITGASELKRVYERIETEVRAQYLLAFESPQSEEETFHEIRVELVEPRRFGRGVKVQHPPGYFQ